jgi:hypothetical protein
MKELFLTTMLAVAAIVPANAQSVPALSTTQPNQYMRHNRFSRPTNSIPLRSRGRRRSSWRTTSRSGWRPRGRLLFGLTRIWDSGSGFIHSTSQHIRQFAAVHQCNCHRQRRGLGQPSREHPAHRTDLGI